MQTTLRKLKPLSGKCDGFNHEVKKLQRPYIPISEEVYRALENAEHDYYLYKKQVVTFGNADNGFALMPLQTEFANKILQMQ